MGCSQSRAAPPSNRGPPMLMRFIPDQFASLAQLQQALRGSGLESSNLILGVDFTKSNEWTGKRSFGGRCLHDTTTGTNPYSNIISIIGRTLETFDDDKLIPTYGFGSAECGADKLFSFNPGDAPCHTFGQVMQRYAALAPRVAMAGPTTFAPIIRKACEITAASGGQYHILVIVADGQVTRPSSTAPGMLSSFEQDTVNAIVEASKFPLSIVLVGVGDGPWDLMEHFDDSIPHRKFDNWQSVVVDASLAKRGGSLEYCPPAAEAQFALDALMEVPDQYRYIGQLGLLGRAPGIMHSRVTVLPPPDALGGGVQVPGGSMMPQAGGYAPPNPGAFPQQGGGHPGAMGGFPAPHPGHPVGGGFPPPGHPGAGGQFGGEMEEGPPPGATAVPPPLPAYAAAPAQGGGGSVMM